uniref:Uncharacterized protein n=1 Tax=Anguilla anguilla TaxID=7936 RepID=A0A0E9UXF8_ANGAN
MKSLVLNGSCKMPSASTSLRYG